MILTTILPKLDCMHKFFVKGDIIEIDFKRIKVNFTTPVDDKEKAEVISTACDHLYAKIKDGRVLGIGNAGLSIKLITPSTNKVERVPCYEETFRNVTKQLQRYPFTVGVSGTK